MENRMKDFLKCGAAGVVHGDHIYVPGLPGLRRPEACGEDLSFYVPIYGMGPFWALSAGVWTGIFSVREKRIRRTGSCVMD